MHGLGNVLSLSPSCISILSHLLPLRAISFFAIGPRSLPRPLLPPTQPPLVAPSRAIRQTTEPQASAISLLDRLRRKRGEREQGKEREKKSVKHGRKSFSTTRFCLFEESFNIILCRSPPLFSKMSGSSR